MTGDLKYGTPGLAGAAHNLSRTGGLDDSLEAARRHVAARRAREARVAEEFRAGILARKAAEAEERARFIGPPDMRGVLIGPVDMRPFMDPKNPKWRLMEGYDLRDAWKWPPPWKRPGY